MKRQLSQHIPHSHPPVRDVQKTRTQVRTQQKLAIPYPGAQSPFNGLICARHSAGHSQTQLLLLRNSEAHSDACSDVTTLNLSPLKWGQSMCSLAGEDW